MRNTHPLAGLAVGAALLAMLWPADAFAQRGGHGGGRGGGGAHGGGRSVVVVRGGYGYPYWGYGYYYGYPFYDPFWGGYPWYPFPLLYPPPNVYAGTYGAPSSLRLQVTPRETEVYVDGYRAGTADDFDGYFQRLQLPPGPHEILLYLDGYHTVRQSVHLSAGATFKIRHTMEKLRAGETTEPRPAQPEPPAPPQPSEPPGLRVAPGPPPAPAQEGSRFGSLSVRTQPAGADVLIDGELWRGPDTAPLVVQLAEGTHRLEVRKDGYEPFVTDVHVRRGETTTLNVSLPAR